MLTHTAFCNMLKQLVFHMVHSIKRPLSRPDSRWKICLNESTHHLHQQVLILLPTPLSRYNSSLFVTSLPFPSVCSVITPGSSLTSSFLLFREPTAYNEGIDVNVDLFFTEVINQIVDREEINRRLNIKLCWFQPLQYQGLLIFCYFSLSFLILNEESLGWSKEAISRCHFELWKNVMSILKKNFFTVFDSL